MHGYQSDLPGVDLCIIVFALRDAGGGLFIVKFKVRIQVDVCRNRDALLYKYVVFSQRNKEGHPYEYLHGAPYGSGHKNRALKISKDKIFCGGK